MHDYGRLVLARKPKQKIEIDLPDGRTIYITHNGYSDSGATRLVVEAPRDINICRSEVRDKYNG